MDRLGATLEDLAPEKERGIRFPQVVDGSEMFRILGLQRRPPPALNPASADLAEFLTNRLAKSASPYPGALRPLQAAALKEAWECGGLAGFIAVGGGKSLVSALLPTVLGAKAPLYMAPANMRTDILAEFKRLHAHWHTPADLPFLSYEMLSNPAGGEDFDDAGNLNRVSVLERIRPDLLIFDEAHALASLGNVATKRVRAYLKKHPKTRVVCLTGTPFRSSIKEAAHLLEWALGDKSPLPRPGAGGYLELQAWADYLDVRASSGVTTGVGSLMRFLTEDEQAQFSASEGEQESKQIVRRAVARHIYETAGVLSSQGDGKLHDDSGREIGLEVRALMPRAECHATDEFFETLRRGELPDGTPLADNLSKVRHALTAGNSYWSKYDPEPPKYWRDARTEWARWCAAALQGNRRGIDSEARMVKAVRKGLYNDQGKLAAWESAQRQYKEATGLDEPPSVAVWLSDQAVDEAAAWVAENRGLVWVNGVELGQRIATRCGVPFYREKGRDDRKRHIKDHEPGTPAVASFAANRVGRNLQGIWCRQLFMCTPEEQSLARVHRSGQTQDVVVDVYIGCLDHLKTFERARDAKAAFASAMVLAAQKLEIADGHIPSTQELADRGGPRWTK